MAEENSIELKWWQKIFSFFSLKGKKKQDAIVEPELVKSGQEKFFESISGLLKHLEDSLKLSGNDKELMEVVNSYVARITSIHENFGRSDGKVGTKNFSIVYTAKAYASQIAEHVYSVFKGRMDGIKDEIEFKKEKKVSVKELLDKAQKFYEFTLNYSRQSIKDFSRSRGILYITFGFILLFADIPLSLNIVSYYDLIPEFDKGATIWEKLGNIEATLFSFGIAFCTIYIKILYDEYINTKLGTWTEELNEFDEADKPKVKQEKAFKLIIKLIILFFLLLMLYNIGIFRNINGGAATNTTGGNENPYNVRFWSYTLMTIIIPTISGICLSIGFSIFNNRKSLQKSEEKFNQTRLEFDEICKEINELSVKSSQLSIPCKEWEKIEHKVKILSEQFIGSYNQGYKRGYASEFGFDLYKIIEEYHDEQISQSLNKKI